MRAAALTFVSVFGVGLSAVAVQAFACESRNPPHEAPGYPAPEEPGPPPAEPGPPQETPGAPESPAPEEPAPPPEEPAPPPEESAPPPEESDPPPEESDPPPEEPVTRTLTGTREQAGDYGYVQVQITMTDAQLTDITMLEETSNPNSAARDAPATLIQEALAAQSADIDNVSQATYTSDAFKASLQAALDQA